MEDELYELWVASVQNGYIGNLVDITKSANGAKNLYHLSEIELISSLGLSAKLAKHITRHSRSLSKYLLFSSEIQKSRKKIAANAI